MNDKPENFDSEKSPGLGIALAQVEQHAMAHKELLGPPEVYANIYHAISSAYMGGLQMAGRGLLPSDIYALQMIEGLTMQAIRPGSPALLSAARAALTGAGMEISAGMAHEAAQKAAEAEKQGIWDEPPEGDDEAPAGDDKLTKPETLDAAEVAAVEAALAGEIRGAPANRRNWILNDGERLPDEAKPGDVVHARHPVTGQTHRVGTVAPLTGDRPHIAYDKPAKPEKA